MKLFHQLEEADQHRAVHYCMHNVVEDMLEDGVEIEAHSEEDKRRVELLEKAINEALALPEEEQFKYIVSHTEAGQFCFDMAIDMARATYYHPNEDMVIYFEELRDDHNHDGNDDHDHSDEEPFQKITENTQQISKKLLN